MTRAVALFVIVIYYSLTPPNSNQSMNLIKNTDATDNKISTDSTIFERAFGEDGRTGAIFHLSETSPAAAILF